MSIIEAVCTFIASNARYIRQKSKVARRLAVWIQWSRLFILRHIVTASACLVAAVCMAVFFYPWVLPKRCSVLKPQGEWVVSSNAPRACQSGSLIALSWRAGSQLPEPRGRILVRLPTTSEDKGLWREYYANIPSNRHDWKIEGLPSSNENLPVHGCEAIDDKTPLQTRSGFRLRSEPRALGAHKLSAKRGQQCHRASHLDPQFADCGWGYLELFVEIDSTDWCRIDNLLDYYRSDRLVRPETARLCARTVNLQGQPTDGYHQIGEIQRVWCD